MADLEDKKVSQLESGTVTSNSVFLDSGNGVSTKVGSQDVANFVGKTHAFSGSGGLNTTAKTLVGAINEVAGSAGKSNLADMDDVNIDDQTLTDGQTIIYDDTNDEWVNGDVASTLESLTDVDIDSTSLADGQAIVYDETSDKWVNGTVSGGASVVQKTLAEYQALPTEAKMNGSIYKITDKALIYCLDEEYHALKEIASAAYAQLTPAEQNNGTIYVKTDEETTAADIPYSAGVSVADKLATIPTVNVIDINENFTSSTTMAYTGVSFELPANKSAIITVMAVYAANKPNMVTVNTSSTNVNAQVLSGTYINKGTQASGILVNKTNATKTYYVWAEYAGAGANMIEVHGITI